jgi:hypothetical protein
LSSWTGTRKPNLVDLDARGQRQGLNRINKLDDRKEVLRGRARAENRRIRRRELAREGGGAGGRSIEAGDTLPVPVAAKMNGRERGSIAELTTLTLHWQQPELLQLKSSVASP